MGSNSMAPLEIRNLPLAVFLLLSLSSQASGLWQTRNIFYGTGVPDIPGSLTTTIGGYSYSNSGGTMSCSYYYSYGAMVHGQICFAPFGGWKTCRYPPHDCNLDWPKLYNDLQIAYNEHKEKMEKLKVNMANMKVNMDRNMANMKANMDRNMANMKANMAKMNEKFSAPCFPFC